jgi:hypothetical protein
VEFSFADGDRLGILAISPLPEGNVRHERKTSNWQEGPDLA